MTLKKIALILVIAALIGSSAGIVTTDTIQDSTQEQNGHCENWDPGPDWQNHTDDPGRERTIK